MPGSKPGALPLGDIPTKNYFIILVLIRTWCGRRDLNSHNRSYWNLNPARLPIPPLPHRLCNKTQFAILSSQLSYSLNNFPWQKKLAGIPGFEPGNARIKTWCLTAWRYPNKELFYNFSSYQNMVRKERLELSQPKLLEPKSSASTNSATPALLCVIKHQVVILNSSLSCNLTLAEPFLKEEMVAKTGFEPVTPSL